MQSNEAKAFEDATSLDGVFFGGTSADLETVADLPFSCEARDFMSNLEKIIEEENHNSGIRQPDIVEPRKPMPRSQPKKKRNAFHRVACMMMAGARHRGRTSTKWIVAAHSRKNDDS